MKVRTKMSFDCSSSKLEDIKKFLGNSEGNSDECVIDFNKVKSVPAGLSGWKNNIGLLGMKYIRIKRGKHARTESDRDVIIRFNSLSKDEKSKALYIGEKFWNNMKKYGYANKYEWCIDNWGSKSNGSSCVWNGNTLSFETPIMFPKNIVSEISKAFSDVRIDFEYADDDFGKNSGNGYSINGEVSVRDFVDGSVGAISCYNRVYQ